VALRAAVTANRAKGGSLIVVDPRSGDVLAMATYPWFDPNHFSDYAEAAYQNLPGTAVSEPGSVYKVITPAAAPEEHIRTEAYCSGALVNGNHTIHCAHGRAHGRVDRARIIDGSNINPGDVILGLASNGLHTNGYSLARKLLFEKMGLKVSSRLPESNVTVGEELLRVHKNYQQLLAKIPSGIIKGLAHITGGGLIDNLPRILPKNCNAVIDTKSWRVPPIFQILQRNGDVDPAEMYQVFNMGIGMVAIVSEGDVQKTLSILKAKQIGRTELGRGKTKLVF